MTQAEMLREMRQDMRDLREKMELRDQRAIERHDRFMEVNTAAHQLIHEKLGEVKAEMREKTGINTTKVGMFVALISIFVAALVSTGMARMIG